jgi:LuxR family maltose regulon positive regulatory protein
MRVSAPWPGCRSIVASRRATVLAQRRQPGGRASARSVHARTNSDFDGEALVPIAAELARSRTTALIDDLHCSSRRRSRNLRPSPRADSAAPRCAGKPPDPQLGLHRSRLNQELTEIRASDLRFSLDEARAPGTRSSCRTVLYRCMRARRVGRLGYAWQRSLARHQTLNGSSPNSLVASGWWRSTCSEVLERQPEKVRRLLLRTSILSE